MSTSTDLRFPFERDGKTLSQVSSAEFLVTTGLMLPLWATVILPLTLVYQVGKGISNAVLPSEDVAPIKIDSGYAVVEGDIIPRPKRTYDVVLLGATGFTGKLAVRYLAKTYGVNKKVKWAIAGRSQAKLEQVKTLLAKELDLEELLELDTIVVDTSVASTLPKLVRDTRTVISTAGPFSQYGNSVVEFSVKFGTHYADITGETNWVKTMMTQWQDTAQKTGAKIISFCGHDCVPWDMTVYQMAETLKAQTGEGLASVTCMNEMVSSMSGGTALTLALGMNGKLPSVPLTDPFRITAAGTVHSEPMENKLPLSILKFKMPWNGEYAYGSPFLMALVNIEAVSWTQALRGGSSLAYKEYSVNPDLKTAFVGYCQLIVFFTGLMNPITAHLIQNYVLPKPGQGPSMSDMEDKHFLSVYAQGVGTKGSQAEAVMYFPQCPGYLETARMLTESGLSLALEEEKLPSKGGGFFSPAYGLGNVLLKRLTDTGTYFQSRLKESKS